MANGADEAARGGAGALVGSWALRVNTPFGVQPITFTVERSGGALTGVMRHERGAADVTDIRVRGHEFTAQAGITLKGTHITADVTGQFDAAHISGNVKVHLPLAPLVTFTGIRQ
ncbi:MAG TPA: hypothetical protein VF546_05340 [Pyrinomonadaceae bacterium]|jgi:hypothetical protein